MVHAARVGVEGPPGVGRAARGVPVGDRPYARDAQALDPYRHRRGTRCVATRKFSTSGRMTSSSSAAQRVRRWHGTEATPSPRGSTTESPARRRCASSTSSRASAYIGSGTSWRSSSSSTGSGSTEAYDGRAGKRRSWFRKSRGGDWLRIATSWHSTTALTRSAAHGTAISSTGSVAYLRFGKSPTSENRRRPL